MKNRLWLIPALLLVIAGCSQVTEGKEAEYIFRFAHEESPSSVQADYVKEFADKLEKKSNGRIKVERYPIGQLGNATEQAELLQIGAIDFAIVSPGNTGTIVPENQLFSLHFLFSDEMDVNKQVLNESDALYEDLNSLYLEKNIKVLDYWTEGFMNWTSNQELAVPTDFNGFKMRTMPSPLIVAAYEAYGANPTPVPYMEVYSGLQLNMIDGQENPMFAIEEMNFYEVQKYLTLSKHGLYITTTAVNPDFYESLPNDIQHIVDETTAEMQVRSFAIQNEFNQSALDQINSDSDINVAELNEEERQKFEEQSQEVREYYKRLVGEEGAKILDKLEKDIQKAEKNQ
ncbi:DctP family TRAP transporter solute-binding subunit [Guptibacillus hwajinpoensis]|uniref:DctP family TRAP transporter solute-binding subunit n=1 Tax=Guptibacillus hwajinpoensis TaxID=208199 RepID=UPI001CFF3A68|nr:DctP family TRAP transporter solute-binding subunit [Pseudalkalibacillus hwajinpoensis]WLR57840.1 DctP family TRAP transporter solute-binding subunit [Pseudalkalibacillus hwajinpoensis]